MKKSDIRTYQNAQKNPDDFLEVQTTSWKSRRLPGSPDDFLEVQTTSWKSRRLPGSRDDFVRRLPRSPDDFQTTNSGPLTITVSYELRFIASEVKIKLQVYLVNDKEIQPYKTFFFLTPSIPTVTSFLPLVLVPDMWVCITLVSKISVPALADPEIFTDPLRRSVYAITRFTTTYRFISSSNFILIFIFPTTPATLNWHSDGYMAHESSRAGPCWAGNYMLDGMKLATGLAVSAEQGSEEGSLELLVRGKKRLIFGMKSDFLDDLVQNTTVPCRLAFKRLVNVQIGCVLETCVDKICNRLTATSRNEVGSIEIKIVLLDPPLVHQMSTSCTSVILPTNSNVLVIGGDGYCGWATALHVSKKNYEVTISVKMWQKGAKIRLTNFTNRL
ncbi:hypothetical protein YC2023_023842 [Brassica napus]